MPDTCYSMSTVGKGAPWGSKNGNAAASSTRSAIEVSIFPFFLLLNDGPP